ncbi:MAG: hypothetical protein QOI89_2298 [Solirubrobacteraceae bacterium]|jgi:murein DD-endopeptidase MepM/ murein hydrolase activator NlpD|nr:hypothetical protein [Solirubrobacteraceae bacterium]
MVSPPGLDAPRFPHATFQTDGFLVDRFEYAPCDLLLRLAMHISLELPSSAPVLFAGSGGREHAFMPLVYCTGGLPTHEPDGSSWRGSFAVPSDLASDPRAWFALKLSDALWLALPRPSLRGFDSRAPMLPVRTGRGRPRAGRRGALLFLVSCQLCVAPGWSAAVAVADGPAAPGSGEELTAETPPAPSPEGPTEAPLEPPVGGPGPPAPETPTAPTSGPAEAGPETQPATAGTASGPVHDATSEPASGTSGGPVTDESQISHEGGSSAASPITPSRAPAHRAAKVLRHRAGRHVQRPGAPSEAQVLPDAASIPALSQIPPVLSALLTGLDGSNEDAPPAYLVPIYREAGRRYDVPWRVLAAINAIESDYGRNLAVSSAGAVGWMQFMPDTWREWAVDADNDGQMNPYSPQDAIFTAARYLQASGAARDLPAAIFAYNHADWYVTEVLLRARMLGGVASFARIEKGYSLPLDERYMSELGRTDDGVDIETAPDGALVYSMTPGVVSAVAADPAGFGPNYPVIEATSGALKGQHIYYGHVAESLVRPGQPVAAGQPIAIIGHTGDAVLLGHGHIEIGFSDAGGDPLSHHGPEAWTPAGDVMRSFLVALSSEFGVHNA